MTAGYHHDKPLGIHDDGTAEVTCWCEARIVLVPLAEMRQGLTRRCSVGCELGGEPQRRPRGSGTSGRRVAPVLGLAS